jgi:hypothetical protein
MKSFYKYLFNKEEKPVALQKAQMDYISSADNINSHPFYWSGFLMVGNNHPVYFLNPFIKWGIPAIILLLLVYLLIRIKRKKRSTLP